MIKYFSFLALFLFVSIQFTYAQDGIIQIDSSQDIKNLVAKKKAYNATNNSLNNFQIQLFYGSENGAESTLSKFRELFPDTTSKLEFESPNWKAKVGKYKTRLIADKHLKEIQLIFGDAIVLEMKK